MVRCPSAYQAGYAKARLHDQAAAGNYIEHTKIGDPALDSIMEELSSLPPSDLHRFTGAGIEQRDDILQDAPQVLRNFFKTLDDEPQWLDHEAFRPGVRAFHNNVDLMLVAFVTGVLVEGFSTLIAKSFNITGRVASTKRRLQQNNRHMMDIFFLTACSETAMGGSSARAFASFMLESGACWRNRTSGITKPGARR